MVAVEVVDPLQKCAPFICLSRVLEQEGEHFVLKIQTSGPGFTISRMRFGIFVTLKWLFALGLSLCQLCSMSALTTLGTRGVWVGVAVEGGGLLRPRGCECRPRWDLFGLGPAAGRAF